MITVQKNNLLSNRQFSSIFSNLVLEPENPRNKLSKIVAIEQLKFLNSIYNQLIYMLSFQQFKLAISTPGQRYGYGYNTAFPLFQKYFAARFCINVNHANPEKQILILNIQFYFFCCFQNRILFSARKYKDKTLGTRTV